LLKRWVFSNLCFVPWKVDSVYDIGIFDFEEAGMTPPDDLENLLKPKLLMKRFRWTSDFVELLLRELTIEEVLFLGEIMHERYWIYLLFKVV